MFAPCGVLRLCGFTQIPTNVLLLALTPGLASSALGEKNFRRGII
jgi:hypothetical protein